MKQIAIMCCGGIGDSLLMMIAAHQFKEEGYAVTLFGESTELIAPLFTGYHFLPKVSFADEAALEARLKPFDRVIVQNDHSALAYAFFKLRERNPQLPILFFFPTFCPRARAGDFLFNRQQPMATNIAQATASLLKKTAVKTNGLLGPTGKEHRRHLRRVVIHPTSKKKDTVWKKSSYLHVAKRLQQQQFSVAFAVSPAERKEWLFAEKRGIDLPLLPTLRDVAAYFYESGFFIGNDSGMGHLASNLNIPTLTVSGHLKWVQLWRPDWSLGVLAVPCFPLPNFKGIGWRFREKHWSCFVSVKRVLKAFSLLVALQGVGGQKEAG